MSKCPLAAAPDMFEPVADTPDRRLETAGRKNAVGPLAMATPLALAGWAEALHRYGCFSLADVLQPAVRYAARGFIVSPYLAECTAETAADLATDAEIARKFLPGGAPILAGAAWFRGIMPRPCGRLRTAELRRSMTGRSALH